MKSDIDMPTLDESYVDFVQGAVSLIVAARNAANVPTVTRAYGCAVSADRRVVTVFVAEEGSIGVLQDIADNGAIAVASSRPSTARTMQFKGDDAKEVPFAAVDRVHVERWRRTFRHEIESMGYVPPFSSTLTDRANEPMRAIRFTLKAMFDQSPGPTAGRRLEG